MQLLTLILNKTECMDKIVLQCLENHLGGPTVLNCEGAIRMLDPANIEPLPIFGILRQLRVPQNKEAKLLLLVLKDEKVPLAKKIIDEAVGGINNPDTGIIFTIALSSVEGLAQV